VSPDKPAPTTTTSKLPPLDPQGLLRQESENCIRRSHVEGPESCASTRRDAAPRTLGTAPARLTSVSSDSATAGIAPGNRSNSLGETENFGEEIR
jgi:hypothetical protein